MNETLRAWLILIAIILVGSLLLWGLPWYVGYWKVEMAKADIRIEQIRRGAGQ